MKELNHICLVIIFLLVEFYSVVNADEPQRIHFNINPKDRKIVLPVQLNDSITARLEFDTGGSLVIDSTFCQTHIDYLLKADLKNNLMSGVGWTTQRTLAIVPKTTPRLSIGGTELTEADHSEIWNWSKYMHSSNSVGMFNIPANDTTNIWELNFENNYMEIHSSSVYKIPENCFVVPIVKDKFNPQRFMIPLTLKVKCMDGDTTTLTGNFLIDTAMPWDISILHKPGDLPFFNNRNDAVWTGYVNDYYRHYNTNVSLFNDGFMADSVRVYSFEYPNCMKSYILGQNFLKRFNVFFDLKNRKVGLQPLQNFQRIVDPLYRRFHYSVVKNTKGKFIVMFVADYKENYYKTAGLQKGDEIVTVDGKPYKDISREERRNFYTKEKLVFDIIRKGIPLKIVVRVDKNEKQGD